MSIHKNSFAKIFPLYYVLFVFVFIFIYLVISGSASFDSLRNADQSYAASERGYAVSRRCTAPPCHGFWCWLWKFRGTDECFYKTPVPVASATPTPTEEPLPTPLVSCIPRPPCLDAQPYSCKIVEPVDGWCTVSPLPTAPVSATPVVTKEPIMCPMYMLMCPDGSYAAPDPNNNCKAKCNGSRSLH